VGENRSGRYVSDQQRITPVVRGDVTGNMDPEPPWLHVTLKTKSGTALVIHPR
jgi:hypothetical protein